MADENKKIKKITLGGNTYDIWATSVDAKDIKFGENNQIDSGAISGVSADKIIWTDADGNVPEANQIPEGAISSVPASALKASALSGIELPWNSISGLKVDYSTENMEKTSGIMTPAEIQQAIDAQIAGVYKVMGTTTAQVDSTGAITGFDPAVETKNGNVYNVALPRDTDGKLIVTSAELDGQIITDGDNIVYVSANSKWDKLAGSIDTSTMATTAWTTAYINSGAISSTTTALWTNVTSYINNELGSANSANATALWTDIVSTVTSGIDAQVWDKTIQDAETLSSVAEGGTASSTSGKYLVGAGAIVDYVKDQIDSTIQETIDVVSGITMSGSKSGTDWGSETTLSSIPNVKAVTSFANENFIAKQDIRYDETDMALIIDNR